MPAVWSDGLDAAEGQEGKGKGKFAEEGIWACNIKNTGHPSHAAPEGWAGAAL